MDEIKKIKSLMVKKNVSFHKFKTNNKKNLGANLVR